MSECFAMAIGFILGAACAIGTVLFTEKKDEPPHPSALLTPSPQGEGFSWENSKRQELLKKQWENFLNYDGTEKDQMQIGEE